MRGMGGRSVAMSRRRVAELGIQQRRRHGPQHCFDHREIDSGAGAGTGASPESGRSYEGQLEAAHWIEPGHANPRRLARMTVEARESRIALQQRAIGDCAPLPVRFGRVPRRRHKEVPGLRSRSTSTPRPRRSITPVAKFSTKISDRATKSRAISTAVGSFRFKTTPRLPWPSTVWSSEARPGSPRPGASILITSAPIAAK